jgi:hypothetical protein
MPQHASASQQNAATRAMPGDAANAAELETSIADAANNFIFMVNLLVCVSNPSWPARGAAAVRDDR